MSEARVALVTAPDMAVAEQIVRTLVDERLVACGNILPGVVSIFRWEGRIQRDGEVLIVLKTAASRVAALQERVSILHPYDVPEVLVLPVESGHGPYVDWVLRESGAAED